MQDYLEIKIPFCDKVLGSDNISLKGSWIQSTKDIVSRTARDKVQELLDNLDLTDNKKTKCLYFVIAEVAEKWEEFLLAAQES